jgi:hypothetical protein
MTFRPGSIFTSALFQGTSSGQVSMGLWDARAGPPGSQARGGSSNSASRASAGRALLM